MVLEIFGVLFIALGLFGLHQAIEGRREDKDTFILLTISLILLFLGVIMFIKVISFETLIKRILGIISILFGFFLFAIFPGTGYTLAGFKNVGLFFGFLIFIFGLYLLFL